MPLVTGSRLGVYTILDALGAGGMGEVYRALDTRLGREVAVKALPEEFSRDAARLLRFEREARMLAALNHPAVAAIYGLEDVDGTSFIVMELVPGQTLSEKLSRGALPLDESLRIGRQIAEALEAAHDRGIVHRDLKPANIKVTPEGRVKVLDLGLAKAFDRKETSSGSDPSLSPTLVLEGTQPGVILGTADFMSPEQARGKPVDKRTDIWAFGCVLYEMLSGRRAFTGETVTDVLAAIVTTDPDWNALPENTPPRIRELLLRCLQKDPARRLRDVGDARIEIEEALADLDTTRSSPGRAGLASGAEAAAPPLPRRRRAALVLVTAVGAALALFAGWRLLGGYGKSGVSPGKYLAVLPFRDLSGLPDGQLIGDGLAVTVSTRLSGIPGLQIVSPTAVVKATDEESEVFRIAKRLGANLVLQGSFQRRGDRVRITYTLRTLERIQIAADSLNGSASDLFDMQDRLAERVAASLGLSLAVRPASPPGLETASEQDRYLQAIGNLQRYDKAASVDEGIRLLQFLAVERPSAALVHASLARGYLQQFTLTRERAWVDLASAACDRAQQLDPTLPEVDVTLGELRTQTGQADQGILAFERALARQPDNLEARLGIARAYAASGQASKAEESYRNAIRLQPDYWASYSQLGAFYAKRGKYELAAEMFRRVISITPDNARALANLGAVLFKAGKFEEARLAYMSSIRVKPVDAVYANLGTLEFYTGRFTEAARAFEQATRLTPGKPLYWSNLGDAYRWVPALKSRSLVAYERAIKLAGGELSVNPESDAAHRSIANCLAKTGRTLEARAHIQRALSLNPVDPETLYGAAIVATLEGKRDEAIAWIGKARDNGFPIRQIEREPEFHVLQELPAYQDLVGKKRTGPST